MAKKGKLLTALDAHRGRDYEAEKKKKQVKEAEKRKRKRQEVAERDGDDEPTVKVAKTIANGTANGDDTNEDFAEFPGEGEDAADVADDLDEDDDEDDDEEPPSDDADVPLSDLSASDLEDTVPHQRLTINNATALSASRKRISVVRPTMPFSSHNSLVSSLPATSADANDDLTREAEFYTIAKDAVLSARKALKKEGVPFTRPADYFAEMVKSDEHMGKIKKKMYDEAARKKGSEEARKLRDAKKFGKQVQIAKEQERSKEKRATLDKIKDLKKRRKGQLGDSVKESDNLFEGIDVEDAPKKDRQGRERGPGAGGKNLKRDKRDQKYGFGGKKRHAKSGDAASAGDMRGFSAKKMKGKPAAAKRPGKNRRAAAR